jgi:hypothetical protein
MRVCIKTGIIAEVDIIKYQEHKGKFSMNIENNLIEIEVPKKYAEAIQNQLIKYGYADFTDFKTKIEFFS